MNAKNGSIAKIRFIQKDFSISDLDSKNWEKAPVVTIDKYWSGKTAPPGRRFSTKLLWSNTALYVRFEAVRAEPLIINATPDLKSKSRGLWDRDVCEIFIAPDEGRPNKYFEFEIAPNGEWLDLRIEWLAGDREVDGEYASGMTSAARIDDQKVIMAIKIEWIAFGTMPKAGDIWLGNLLRCVGQDPDRGYLAWQPTMTQEPNFHVPERFGRFEFVR